MQIQAVDANIFNIGIDCFALILLCIIFSSGHDRSQNDLDASNFSLIIRMAIIATVFDILTWIEIEFPSSKQVGYAYLINCMLFFFQNVSIFCWLNYSLSRIYRRPLTKTELKKYFAIPLATITAAIFTVPLTGLFFTINANGVYSRTSTANILFLMDAFIAVVPSYLALRQRKKEVLPARRTEMLTIAAFPVMIIPGAIIQILVYGITVIFPLTALSFLNVYMKRQNDMVTRDALTGLNNRGQLDRYLYSLLNSGSVHKTMTYIIADLNDFKQINDHFGHNQGDKALTDTAGILKDSFFGEPAFLARYGGDEFVIVLKTGSQEEVDKIICKMRLKFKNFNETRVNPFDISISIGYAIFGETDCFTIVEIMEKADRRMYEDKRKTKALKAVEKQ